MPGPGGRARRPECPHLGPGAASRAGMEATMTRRCRTDPQLGLEVGFEPRRGGREVLADAYRRLLPPTSRPVCPARGARTREEAGDARASDGPGAGAAGGPDPGGDLRQGVLRPAG